MKSEFLLLCFLLGTTQALAAPPPGAVSPYHDWFEKQQNTNHGLCCNEADGHILAEEDWRSVGTHYEVRIDDVWYEVPPHAMVIPDGGPNPTGHAVVWYVRSSIRGVVLMIHCFLPGFQG